MSDNLQKILEDANKSKITADFRIQAALINYQAAAYEQNEEKCRQLRDEIHALQDIILDSIYAQMYCVVRSNPAR